MKDKLKSIGKMLLIRILLVFPAFPLLLLETAFRSLREAKRDFCYRFAVQMNDWQEIWKAAKRCK